MRPAPSPRPHVAPCSRCGLRAERPVLAAGRVASRDREHLPLCVGCLRLLLEGVRGFWEGLPRGGVDSVGSGMGSLSSPGGPVLALRNEVRPPCRLEMSSRPRWEPWSCCSSGLHRVEARAHLGGEQEGEAVEAVGGQRQLVQQPAVVAQGQVGRDLPVLSQSSFDR